MKIQMISKCPNKHSLESPANRVFASFCVRKQEITNRTRSHQTEFILVWSAQNSTQWTGDLDLCCSSHGADNKWNRSLTFTFSWRETFWVTQFSFPHALPWLCCVGWLAQQLKAAAQPPLLIRFGTTHHSGQNAAFLSLRTKFFH